VHGENSGGALFKADNFLSPSLIKQKTVIERIRLPVSGYALRSTRSSMRELSCLFAAGGDHFPRLTEFFQQLDVTSKQVLCSYSVASVAGS
jgi:hypothetical protein